MADLDFRSGDEETLKLKFSDPFSNKHGTFLTIVPETKKDRRNLVVDVILTVMTGGCWLFWVIIREGVIRRKASN